MREQGTGIREQGSGRAKLWLVLVMVAVVAVVGVFAFWNGEAVSRPLEPKKTSASRIAEAVPPKDSLAQSERSGQETASPLSDEAEDDSESEEGPLTAEERAVNAFDDLTDKWQEPSAKGVTMSDIDNFAKSFRSVPRARQDECIHRALNLIPDENVMLLAGVLMDKSMDKEIVAAIYNDILNRGEDVKKPILQEIYKDKSHSCWDDTAWILEVTGELPKDK